METALKESLKECLIFVDKNKHPVLDANFQTLMGNLSVKLGAETLKNWKHVWRDLNTSTASPGDLSPTGARDALNQHSPGWKGEKMYHLKTTWNVVKEPKAILEHPRYLLK